MGNEVSHYNEKDVPKKVAKWKAKLEHIKECNKLLREARKAVTTDLEDDLYEKQLKLYYQGKSATKHIGFRGYLKIIAKASPKPDTTSFMMPKDYDPNKPASAQAASVVLRSAILNFNFYSLFEAWLLKRMHFIGIQKNQRRLHKNGWKSIVGFFSEEIPMVQESFAEQEPTLRQKVEQGKKENMALLEEYENKVFQQEEEIIELRRQVAELGIIDMSTREELGAVTLEKAFAVLEQQNTRKSSGGYGDLGQKGMTPVHTMLLKMEKSQSIRELKSKQAEDMQSQASDDESLYTDDGINNKDQIDFGEDNDNRIHSDRYKTIVRV